MDVPKDVIKLTWHSKHLKGTIIRLFTFTQCTYIDLWNKQMIIMSKGSHVIAFERSKSRYQKIQKEKVWFFYFYSLLTYTCICIWKRKSMAKNDSKWPTWDFIRMFLQNLVIFIVYLLRIFSIPRLNCGYILYSYTPQQNVFDEIIELYVTNLVRSVITLLW